MFEIFSKLFKSKKTVEVAEEVVNKPQNLSEGLARIKEALRIPLEAKNLSTKPGERIYTTYSGNTVTINSNPDSLVIEKTLNKDASYHDYIDEVVRVKRNYKNTVRGDKELVIDRDTSVTRIHDSNIGRLDVPKRISNTRTIPIKDAISQGLFKV